MHEMQTRHAPGAWVRGTVLALLIVAGVVALGALSPKVLEAEHRWMVERCPIAYVGEDGRIHLTNERGTLDVELEGVTVAANPYWQANPHPTWSPNGKLIGYTRFEHVLPNGFEQNVVVVEPSSGRTFQPRVATNATFGGWVGDEVLNSDGHSMVARTGTVVQKPVWAEEMEWVSAVPAQAGGGWIVAGNNGLHFLTEDFRTQMPIWSSYGRASGPGVDPSGKWAGWTGHAGQYGDVKIKPIEETVAKPARNVWPPGVGSIFCGWTAEGNVFANVEEGRRRWWGLIILDKQGTVLRRITTDVRPMAGTGASWRGDDGGSR